MNDMPKRQHYLKFQCSIPINKTKASQEAVQNVINSAVAHLKAVAGGAAHNVVPKAFYQDRGPNKLGIIWRDLLVVVGFDGPLTEHAANLMRERVAFEFDRQKAGETGGSLSGTSDQKKILLS